MNGLPPSVIGVSALVAITLHKVRRIHLLGFRVLAELEGIKRELARLSPLQNDLTNPYAQIQSNQSLVSLIHPGRPLPLLRGWAVSPDFLLEICRHSLEHKPGMIIECSSGAPTLALARYRKINGIGHVYMPGTCPRIRRTNSTKTEGTRTGGLGRRDRRSPDGPSGRRRASPAFPGRPIPDARVVRAAGDRRPPWDTAPLTRYPALPLLAEFLASSCTIFLDDANRPDEQEAVKRWMAEHPGFQLTQPLCEKGYAKFTHGSAP